MPVLFVFGQLPLDVTDCVDRFSDLFPELDNRVVIMYDTVYAYACGKIDSFYFYITTELNTELQKYVSYM